MRSPAQFRAILCSSNFPPKSKAYSPQKHLENIASFLSNQIRLYTKSFAYRALNSNRRGFVPLGYSHALRPCRVLEPTTDFYRSPHRRGFHRRGVPALVGKYENDYFQRTLMLTFPRSAPDMSSKAMSTSALFCFTRISAWRPNLSAHRFA